MCSRDVTRILRKGDIGPLKYVAMLLAAIAFNVAVWSGVAFAQVQNPGAQISGAVTFGDCVKMGPGVGQIQDNGAPCAASSPTGANPTATAGPAAVNGVATTFMRSDAAPAVQVGSATQEGIVQVDGSTITAVAGVISGASGANPTATATTSAVNGTSTHFMRSDAAPAVAATTFGGQSVGPGGSATVQGNGAKIQLSTGATTSGHCADYDVNGNVIDAGAPCGGASGANPTATAGPTANNGVATTFMRSDASPAVQSGSNAQLGLAEGDGNGISLSSGVASIISVTKAQQQTGTANNVAVTPSQQQSHDSAVKVWGSVAPNCTTATCTIAASYNVTSITRSGTGSYVVNFTTAFASASYACVQSAEGGGFFADTASRSAGSTTLLTFNLSGGAVDSGFDFQCTGRQ